MSATNAIGYAGNFGSPTQLIIVLVIVLLLFGGKRLRTLGSDLGNAIKGFKNSMSNEEVEKNEQEKQEAQKNY
jgi:sec-independent protein translocase protein TatA